MENKTLSSVTGRGVWDWSTALESAFWDKNERLLGNLYQTISNVIFPQVLWNLDTYFIPVLNGYNLRTSMKRIVSLKSSLKKKKKKKRKSNKYLNNYLLSQLRRVFDLN